MFSRRAKRATIGFVVLGLVIASLTMAVARYFEAREAARRYEDEQARVEPPPVQDYRVERETRVRKRKYPAELLPWMDAGIPAEVSGRVVETFVEPGDQVKEGDPLVRLDSDQAEFRVNEAEARLREQLRLLEEAKVLWEKRAAARTDYEAIASQVRTAQAQLDALKDDLERHVVRAPFEGIVNKRLVDVGDAIRLNDPVIRLVDLDRLRVGFYVSEFDLAAFSKQKKVALRVPSRPEKTYEPTIDFLARSADPTTRLFEVQAVLDNEEAGLPGGIQGVIEAEVGAFNALFVPASAVRFEGEEARVVKINGEKETGLVTVRLGPEVDGFYPVYEGLQAGDRVLIR